MSTRTALVALALCALAACQPHGSTHVAAEGIPPAVRYVDHVAAGGIAAPGATPSNPHRGDAAVARNGALLFTSMNCDGCHGGDAAGWVGPNLGDGRWRYGGSDAEIFASIYYGRPKGMPAFGGTLGPEGVWTLVTYLQSLPVPKGEATESWEP